MMHYLLMSNIWVVHVLGALRLLDPRETLWHEYRSVVLFIYRKKGQLVKMGRACTQPIHIISIII